MWHLGVSESYGALSGSVRVAAFLALLCVPEANQAVQAGEAPPVGSKAVIIRLEGPIMPLTLGYMQRKLATAKQDGADVVIVEIDSPGGEVNASLDIAKTLSHLEWAETVAYVPGNAQYGALSGAAFVALGCDRIVMGERAAIGDAGVIMTDGNNPFRYVPEKQLTHIVNRVRDLAETHGRPPALAEAMVMKDLEVFRVRNPSTGEETYMSEKELAAADEEWVKGKPVQESLGGNFFEVNGARAVELGLAEGNAVSREELIEQLGVAGTPKVLEWSNVDTAVAVLNHPVVTALLFIIGLIALYVEMSSPGISMGILTAGLCFALFFWSRFLGGTADWLDVILFLAGLVFLAVEIFVLPGFGVAGLTGMLLLGVSLILASQRFLIPQTGAELATLTTTLSVLAASMLTFVILAAFMNRYFGSLPLFGRMVLAPPTEESAATAEIDMGPAVGDVGVADSPLRPAGRAKFGHRMLDVSTEGDFVDTGARIQVVLVSGRRVIVAPERG